MEACGIGILTVAELRLVHISSAVALQVLGTLHQIPLVITGVVWFHDPAPQLDLQCSCVLARYRVSMRFRLLRFSSGPHGCDTWKDWKAASSCQALSIHLPSVILLAQTDSKVLGHVKLSKRIPKATDQSRESPRINIDVNALSISELPFFTILRD